MPQLTVVDHPLVQHKLSVMRMKDTDSAVFRILLEELGMLLTYELTRDLQTELVEIETPLSPMKAPMLTNPPPAVISILRAGNGLLGGVLKVIPTAHVGHVGLYRDHETLMPVQYYCKLPDRMDQRAVLVVDPMLATGHSGAAAVTLLKEAGAKNIRFLSILSAPEGVQEFHRVHPDVPLVTAAVDEALNELGYITPGLGDAGDRMYGTK